MEEMMVEKEIKMLLRDERDRLLEIKKDIPKEAEEAIRKIDKRLETIQENLDD